ncbi:uncharacterized protein AKAME5_000008000 [Lates japonicus]|uniref:Uncharacterized protein n=1 Tax=Lates japonicus TaxID=270547 RepID=A0AAD3QUV8_LATJO|nr:uncharacterized protein AKAME5_000008000 [Lates japonicus]
MCDVLSHLPDHNYWRREPHRSQTSTSTSEVFMHCLDDDIILLTVRLVPPRSVSERPAGERQQEIQPLQEPVEDDVTPLPLWPSPYGLQPGGLPPSAFNAVAEMLMAWLTDSIQPGDVSLLQGTDLVWRSSVL